MRTADGMRIVEIYNGANFVEKPDWAVIHAGLDRVPYLGEGQRVGVLDTGCDVNHQDLRGQVEARATLSRAIASALPGVIQTVTEHSALARSLPRRMK